MRNIKTSFAVIKVFTIVFTLSLLLIHTASADELVGEYLYFENLPDADETGVQPYTAYLWIDDDNGEYILQLRISDTEAEYYPIGHASGGRLLFIRNNEAYVFEGFINCNSPLIASGNTINDKWGLWQLWKKQAD